MTADKLSCLKNIIYSLNYNALSSKKNRKLLAHRIAVECNLWEPNVSTFIEEMHGLNLKKREEAEVFLELARMGL